MDADLRELYQQVILDHHRKPRNFGPLTAPDRAAVGFNPLCGDRIQVQLMLDENDRITDVHFTGEGCAICTASASMMTESVQSKTLDEAKQLFHGFHELLTTGDDPGEVDLGKLSLFAGVREFPVRVKCATLPWHTLTAAAENREEPISTE
ncbi:MAG: iron-sulfur cluster assembly scaffold protein [Gemmatimonadota bacterium]|nr:MAG: iron-sulfur cluster assembly scaffold protein [Gemmatimonadota bacterium]